MSDLATLSWYEANHVAYAATTFGLDMSSVRSRFLAGLGVRARILDVGAGSGRDSVAFLEAGHDVVAVEPVAGFVRGLERMGLTVASGTAETFVADRPFDGAFASASLLHLTPDALLRSLEALRRALVPGGVLFTAFKEGRGTRRDADGRLFTDMDEACASEVLRRAGFEVEETWTTVSVRPGVDTAWVNVLARSAFSPRDPGEA